MFGDFPLPPFSGRDADCPKCTRPGAKATYHSEFATGTSGFPCQYMRGIPEHMCRTCEGCSYGWVEAPADAGEATPELSGRHLGLASPGGAEQ